MGHERGALGRIPGRGNGVHRNPVEVLALVLSNPAPPRAMPGLMRGGPIESRSAILGQALFLGCHRLQLFSS